MPALNIRDVDVTLVTLLKQAALERGVTLKSYCIQALESSATKFTTKPAPLSIPGVKLGSELKQEAAPQVFPGNLCTYTEYDQQVGETFGCRLELGHRGSHKRGPQL